MKSISLLLLLSAALSCGNTTENKSQQPLAETSESTSVDAEDTEPILTGKISKEALQTEPHNEWFSQKYNSYKPSPEAVEKISRHIDDYRIEVFMGTWCADSRWEVPKLFKLLEEAGYDPDQLSIYAVDRDKNLSEDVDVPTEFEMVPTIVFYKDGREVNRFVEFAQEDLETDIAKIVSGEEYKNPYAE